MTKHFCTGMWLSSFGHLPTPVLYPSILYETRRDEPRKGYLGTVPTFLPTHHEDHFTALHCIAHTHDSTLLYSTLSTPTPPRALKLCCGLVRAHATRCLPYVGTYKGNLVEYLYWFNLFCHLYLRQYLAGLPTYIHTSRVETSRVE